MAPSPRCCTLCPTGDGGSTMLAPAHLDGGWGRPPGTSIPVPPLHFQDASERGNHGFKSEGNTSGGDRALSRHCQVRQRGMGGTSLSLSSSLPNAHDHSSLVLAPILLLPRLCSSWLTPDSNQTQRQCKDTRGLQLLLILYLWQRAALSEDPWQSPGALGSVG